MNIYNPATGQIIKEVSKDNKASISDKYTAAKSAQKSWASLPLAERIDCMHRFQGLLHERLEDLAETLTSEVGKPLAQSKGEINGAINRIQFFLDNSKKWLREEVISDADGMTERIVYEPLGIIANISAWNYPYLVGVNVFIPGLIGGNAVLYKPSEYATLTGLKIEELINLSGVPEHVFQTIVGKGAAGEALLDLLLDGYFFTGSYRTGKYIYEKVAKKMVPCQLELGGKDPMYITDDNTDIKKAAFIAAEGAFYNNGQSCCAVERIYVHDSVYSEFVSSFLDEVASYKVGDPKEADVFIGPLTREAQIKVLTEQVQDALDKGGHLVLGGRPIEAEGYYFQPTIFTSADHSMKIMKEESFGPVIGIQRVANDAEAVQLMKDTEYGLTSAVVTDSKERADALLSQMDTGTVYWNCCDRVSAYLPWSGRGHSGIGTTLSYLGIRAFVQPKAIHYRS